MTGVDLIAQERERQVAEEGYTAEHDRGHVGDLIGAAAGYAYFQHVTVTSGYTPEQALERGAHIAPPGFPLDWPWKPTGVTVRDLVKAGALIAAAIDAAQERTS